MPDIVDPSAYAINLELIAFAEQLNTEGLTGSDLRTLAAPNYDIEFQNYVSQFTLIRSAHTATGLAVNIFRDSSNIYHVTLGGAVTDEAKLAVYTGTQTAGLDYVDFEQVKSILNDTRQAEIDNGALAFNFYINGYSTGGQLAAALAADEALAGRSQSIVGAGLPLRQGLPR
jgi:hypothetical protein